MENNKIFQAAEDICINGKESLENVVNAIDQGVQVSRFEKLDNEEIIKLGNILKSVIQEYSKPV